MKKQTAEYNYFTNNVGIYVYDTSHVKFVVLQQITEI